MEKKNLIVLDIDDTLTKSEEKHTHSLLFAMKHFGITEVNTDWRTYKHASDSYIFSVNYEKTHNKPFSFELIKEFEEIMTNEFVNYPDTPEIKGAKEAVKHFVNNTNYGVCFATGSIHKPALLKLEQANINFVPDVLTSANMLFAREDIVTTSIEKAKKYYGCNEFENIISFGDGLWDVTTAKNLNLHFVGVNDKNLTDFKKMDVQYHISDWSEFDINKMEKVFGI